MTVPTSFCYSFTDTVVHRYVRWSWLFGAHYVILILEDYARHSSLNHDEVGTSQHNHTEVISPQNIHGKSTDNLEFIVCTASYGRSENIG